MSKVCKEKFEVRKFQESLLNSEDRRIKSLLSNESACPSESYLNGSITDDNLNYNK